MVDLDGKLVNRSFPSLETGDEQIQRFYRVAQKSPTIYQVFQEYLSKEMDLMEALLVALEKQALYNQELISVIGMLNTEIRLRR